MTDTDWDLLSSYAGLLSLATASIYAGAFGSLPKPPRTSVDASGRSLPEDDDANDDDDIPDRLSSSEAWLFPVFGSVALFGLYTIVKYCGKEWINYFLGWYFSIAGVGSVWKSLISLARFTLGNERWGQFDRTKILVLKGPRELAAMSLRTPSIILFPLSIIPSILYTFSPIDQRSVLLTDILSMSFSHNALSLLKIDSFKTGCILLSGLFVYDIWWVFGTGVMVSVATSLDLPIKLLWPKSTSFSAMRGFTMLGLGDIVIPGVFISLALRYDHYRYTKSSSKSSFTKPYFYAALVAYVLGLTMTMTVMHVFGKAQPALLYLSPACILSFFVITLVRGELKDAWSWIDDPPKPLKSTDQMSVDSKTQENGLVVPLDGGADAGQKVVSDVDTSEGESKPKKKKSKKKMA
jgi:minor histocompatibility antigen H13